MRGQERSARIAFAVDQTALAPTILEIAGLLRADWMRAPSLVPYLIPDAAAAGDRLGITEYLETNSAFRPVHPGTVGVTGGIHQHLLNLGTGEHARDGRAADWNIDRSAPEAARELRDDLYSRFPELPRK